MSKKLAWLTLPAFALALACGGDDDDTGTTNNDTGSESGTTGMTAATMTTDMTTTMTTDMTTTMTTDMTTTMTTDADSSSSTDPTDADSSSSGGGSSDSGSSDSGSTGEGDVCAPDAMDDECAMCTKENCCEPLTACYADPDCACFAQCVNEMGVAGIFTCGNMMNCDTGGTPALFNPVIMCVMDPMMGCPACTM